MESPGLKVPSPTMSLTTFPPLNSRRVATVYDEQGRAQLISSRQTPSTVAAPGTFSMEALSSIIQGEREHTRTLVQTSTAPLVAQIAALTQEAKQAKEETARTLRDFQAAQDRNMAAAFTAGFLNMLNLSFYQNLAYAMAQQQQTAPPSAPHKDEDEA